MESTADRGVYNIKCFGAIGDGVAIDTVALQTALDTCHREGGGRVVVPAGTYLIGPVRLRSNIDLHLEKDSVLLGSANHEVYEDWVSDNFNVERCPYNAKYLLVADQEENISITGEGTINGQARAHYDCTESTSGWWPVLNKKTRPGRMILLARCRNVRMEGITCLDAPAWTIWALGCEKVVFHDVTIRTPYNAINTDGIDIDSCRNVKVTHCDIRTGDDAIVLRAIDSVLKAPQPCEQVVVENCTLASNCQAVRIAYLRDGVIRNVTLSNLTIVDSRRGITCQVPHPDETPMKRRDLPLTPGPLVENIRFFNIRIEAGQPLWFYLSDRGCARGVVNIEFENMTLKGAVPSLFKGNAHTSLTNISLKNISIEATSGNPIGPIPRELGDKALVFAGAYLQNLTLSNVTISGTNEERSPSLPLFHFENIAGLDLKGVTNESAHAVLHQ